MEDKAMVERLTQIRGIDRWTAEMLLRFHLGRPDLLSSADYGVRKSFAITYDRELPSPKELAVYGTRWKPYRTVCALAGRVQSSPAAEQILAASDEELRD